MLIEDKENVGLINDIKWKYSFILSRKNDIFIGDLIKTEQEYDKLQERAKEVQISFKVGDINNLYDEEALSSFDLMYLSNIGYNFSSSIEIVQFLLKTNNQKCIITTSVDRVGLSDQDFKKLKPGDEIVQHGHPIKIVFLGENGASDGRTVLEISLREK
jgi:hypothetical protein